MLKARLKANFIYKVTGILLAYSNEINIVISLENYKSEAEIYMDNS